MTAFILTMAGATLAVALELLEALAIVLAVGVSRRWSDAALGALGAVVLLAVVAAVVAALTVSHVGDGVLAWAHQGVMAITELVRDGLR